ncbi:MAG: glycoside hydrolase family 97 protein [Calditrichia bacterium]
MLKKLIFTCLIMFFIIANVFASWEVTSPNGRIKFNIDVKKFSNPMPEGKYLCYSIQYKGSTLINPSPVRLLLKNEVTLGNDLKIVNNIGRSVDQFSELAFGKTKWLHDSCNEMRYFLEEKSKPNRKIILTVRVYDEGAAFHLSIPRQSQPKKIDIENEETFIRMLPGRAWVLPLSGFMTPYENNYQILKTDDIEPDILIGLPLLIHTNDGPWVAVTEANLVDYPGMYLKTFRQEENTFVSRLSPLRSDSTLSARIDTPHDLPWRVFMISDNPGKFIESNIIMNLSDHCQLENTSWIKPGKVAWPWWSDRVVDGRDFKGGMNTATMKYYIDFAADAGLQYLLIDALWYGKHDTPDEDITTTIPEIDMPEIVRYANSKGVGIFLWLYWECVRDQMQKAFPLYEKWGIKGVKVDYMNCDDQDMVNYYRKVVKAASRYHLMVDFHGAYKPTGLRRAFPNLVTREGVLGLEYSKWSQHCSPEHDLIIPFTRMLAGPMDYTPGAFHVAAKDSFKAQFTDPMAQGTRAHQMGMYVVYESPLQMLVDHPSAYFGQTGVEFLKEVPTVWDETKFIKGEVGEYIIIARRNGDKWYLGGMTNWTNRVLSIPLSFLGSGKYMAEIYSDGKDAAKNPTSVQATMKVVNSSDQLEISMAPGGGCAIRFCPTWDHK